MTKATLSGMFFLWDKGQTFSTGQILDEVKDGIYMMTTDPVRDSKLTLPIELMSIEGMLGLNVDGVPVFSLFHTREELNVWVKWLLSPESPSVISIVKPAK